MFFGAVTYVADVKDAVQYYPPLRSVVCTKGRAGDAGSSRSQKSNSTISPQYLCSTQAEAASQTRRACANIALARLQEAPECLPSCPPPAVPHIFPAINGTMQPVRQISAEAGSLGTCDRQDGKSMAPERQRNNIQRPEEGRDRAGKPETRRVGRGRHRVFCLFRSMSSGYCPSICGRRWVQGIVSRERILVRHQALVASWFDEPRGMRRVCITPIMTV